MKTNRKRNRKTKVSPSIGHKKWSKEYGSLLYNIQDVVDEYNLLGFKKESKGDHEGAILCFNKALELNPTHIEIYNNRGLSKCHLKDYLGAMSDFDKAIIIDPNHA